MTPQSGSAAYEASAAQVVQANSALLAMSLIWALNFSIAKDALDTISPLAFNTLRFPLAALVVSAAMAKRGGVRLPEPADWGRLIMLGLLGNLVYQLLFIYGLANTRAGTASVLLAGTPIVTALLTAAAGQERVSRQTWIGAAATVAGITMVVFGSAPDLGGGDRLLGNLLLLGATMTWSAYAVGSIRLIRRYGALSVTTWTLWCGTLGIVLLGLPATLRLDAATLSGEVGFAVLYAGALSIGVAYVLWSYGVRHLGPTRTATYSNVVPVLALLGAWVWLGERPTPWQFLGAAVIIGGVTLAQTRRRATPATVRSPPP